MSVFALTGNVMFFSLTSSSKILHAIFLVIALAIMVILTLVYALHAVLLIWNGIIVWRRESHSLANLLTLIIGVFLLIYPLLSFLFFRKIIPKPYNLMIEHFTEMGAFYMISIFLIFSLSVWICNLYRPKPDKDFIIILGAGLLNGNEVSPLLASRIDRAIDFYQTQINSGQKHPLIICSGGQGGDEKIPEGVAMRNYVLQKNINPDDVVAEDKSVNTIQNFLFSKKIVDRYKLNPNNGIFVSNNYHIYRATDYAKSAGMKISGIGSKTSGFFLPNAIIREFIAILMKHKVANLLVILLFIVISIAEKL
ncbi:YdcF family protein [Apilactobacillus kunkeei]|uniref:YdcF family protein n=1 Tax=Apilactobacillus kunkeei TaxID=148814 RepID=UPI00167E1FEC|nr:YdcF family protein [Apilactobacillus kunkeei]